MDEQNNIQHEGIQDDKLNSVESQSFSKEQASEAGSDNISSNESTDTNKTNREAAVNPSNSEDYSSYKDYLLGKNNTISSTDNSNNANSSNISINNENKYSKNFNSGYQSTIAANPQASVANSNQPQFTNNQITNLERQMLLNNNSITNLSNWTKVMLTALAVLLPGIGQIIGVILGLVFVANDTDADRRSFGAALITVSVIAFVIAAVFWFIFALSFGPDLYYY